MQILKVAIIIVAAIAMTGVAIAAVIKTPKG